MAVTNVKLVVVQGKPANRCLYFGCGEFYFGRGPECQVRAESEWISRQHCVLRVTNGNVSIRDLGSRNGTLVNGTLVSGEHCLLPGDQIQLGPLMFEVQFDTATAAAETVTRSADVTAEIKPGQLNQSESKDPETAELVAVPPPTV